MFSELKRHTTKTILCWFGCLEVTVENPCVASWRLSRAGGWGDRSAIPSYKRWPELRRSAHPQPPCGSKTTPALVLNPVDRILKTQSC